MDFAIRLDIGGLEGQIVAMRQDVVQKKASRLGAALGDWRTPSSPEFDHLLRSTWLAPWLTSAQRDALRSHLLGSEAENGTPRICPRECPLCSIESLHAGLAADTLDQTGVDVLSAGMVHHLAASPPDAGYPDRDIRIASERVSGDAVERLRQAGAILAAAVPWWAELRDDACHRIVLVESENLFGFSSPLVPNTVFLNAECTVAQFVERLVHEATHGQVYKIQDIVRLTEAPGDYLIKSPLRQDPRPVIGVLHATVVCARVHLAMTAAAFAAGDLASEFESIAVSAHENASAGTEVLFDAGRLTNYGRTLVSACQAVVAQ